MTSAFLNKQSLRHYLTTKEEEEAQKAFKIFDQDGSGSISIRVLLISFRNSRQSLKIWGKHYKKSSCK